MEVNLSINLIFLIYISYSQVLDETVVRNHCGFILINEHFFLFLGGKKIPIVIKGNRTQIVDFAITKIY